MKNINEIIESIRAKYAPDKRVAIFQIAIKEQNEEIILEGETNISEAKKELLQTLSAENLQVKDQILLLPSSNLGSKVFGLISVSVANMKAQPSHSSELVSQALLGMPVKIWKKDGSWYYIQTPDDYLGWCEIEQVIPLERDEYIKWTKSKRVIVTNYYSFAYEKADFNSDFVSDIVAGNVFEKLAENDGFVKVKYPDDRIAYINKNDCEDFNKWINSRVPTAENIIKTAKKMMGLPYLWGGTSFKAVDCSGFTKMAFFLNGIILPRDASQQAFAGDAIIADEDFQNLQPGDLLFFANASNFDKENVKFNKLPKITHVALYLGNKDYIHASFKVKINSFDPAKSFYSKSRHSQFVRASRIINSRSMKDISYIKDNKYYNGGI